MAKVGGRKYPWGWKYPDGWRKPNGHPEFPGPIRFNGGGVR